MASNTSKAFVGLEEIILDINRDALDPSLPPVRVAIAISGGGARGAYEGGALEAIMRAFTKSAKGVRPAIVTGTSAGALVGGTLWIDLLFPPRPHKGSLYVNSQSDMWRQIATGNQGANLVVDKPEVIEFVSHQKKLPHINVQLVIQNLSDTALKVEAKWSALVPFFNDLKQSGQQVVAAIMAIDVTTLQNVIQAAGLQSLNDLIIRIGEVEKQITGIPNLVTRSFKTFATSLDPLSSVTIAEGVKALENLFTSLKDTIGNVASLVPDATLVATEFTNFLKNIGSITQSLVLELANIIKNELKELGASLTRLPGNILQIEGVLVDVVTTITDTLAALKAVQPFIDMIFKDNPVRISENALSNEPLINLLSNFIKAGALRGKINPGPGQTFGDAILEHWKQASKAGRPMPELYLTGANLSSQRQLIFAVAPPARIEAFGKNNQWIVDLTMDADRSTAPKRIFFPQRAATDNTIDRDSLVKAIITSTSIPGVFPPQRWVLRRIDGAKDALFKHVIVDGGVIDNTPIDIAVQAGATHVISVELDQLLPDKEFDDDDQRYPLNKVSGDSFTAAMSGALVKTIDAVVQQNVGFNQRNMRASVIQLYRLAPLTSREHSPGVVDFNGHFNPNNISGQPRMSLYDWFMEGYLDASFPIVKLDPVLADYLGSGPGIGCAMTARRPLRRRFWRATTGAIP